MYARFAVLFEGDTTQALYASRGIFLEHTFRELMFDHPLGAGVGRWGMMRVHFGRFDANPSPPIWVEIQPTGWLIDGGLPLMIVYTLAIAVAMRQLYRLAGPAGGSIAFPAAIVLCMNLFMVGQSFAGPAFNSTSGTQFWLCTAVVFAAAGRRAALQRATAGPKPGKPEPAGARA